MKVAHLAPPCLDEFRNADFWIIAHGQGEPLDAVDLAAQNTHVLARVGNLFEEHRRRVFAALENHLDQAAHVFVPGNALDAMKLTDLLDFIQPSAKIVVGGGHLRFLFKG